MTSEVVRGSVVWVALDPTVGREQAGVRPAVVISSTGYLSSVRGLVVVLPITTTDRGWPHHVPVAGPGAGLDRPSFAMTEQPRTVSVERIRRVTGRVDADTADRLDLWLSDFLFEA